MEYKEVIVSKNPRPSKACKAAVARLQTHFRPDELKLALDNKSLRLLLREIDFTHTKATIRNLMRGASPAERDLFSSIFESIKSVRSYGLKSGRRIYVGYADERKVKNRAAKESRRGKFFYAKDSQYEDTHAPFPAAFRNKIICGDSKEILAKIPDNSVDLVFTSPPYNFGLDYGTSPDDFNWEGYFAQLLEIFDECIRVLVYGGRLIINIQPLFSDYIPSHHIISAHMMKRKMIWKGEILWEKNNYNCKYTAWGSWKSPSNPYLKYTWEFIEIFCKGSLKKTGERDKIDINAEEFKKWVIGRWSIAPERRMKEYNHPAMFPEALACRALKLFSYRGDIVLDPFNGAGTTTLAAKKLGRDYLGIDISPAYCKTARERLVA